MTNSLKQFFIGGLSLSAVNISGKIVNLLILPILTFYLLPSDFGIIAIYTLVISILGMFYNPGIISVTLRLYYDNDDNCTENKTLVGSSMLFLIFLPLFIVVLSLFYGDKVFRFLFSDFNFWPYGLLAILAAVATQPVRLWSILWVAKRQTKRVALVSLARILLAVSISLILIVLFKRGPLGRIIGLFVGNMAILSIALYDISIYTKFKFSIKSLLNTLVLGFPLMFSVFSYVIMNSSDKYMLERMVGLSDVGIYDIAYTFSAIPLFIIVGFSQVWQPVFYENMKKDTYDILLRLSKYYIIIFTLISLSVIFFSNEVFNFFVNKIYIDAIKIIPWIVFGIFFLGLSNLIVSIYSYQKRFKEIGFIAVFAAAINILLNYIFISKKGLTGAAMASAISYIIYFLILFFRIKKDVLKVFSIKTISLAILIITISFISFLFINKYYLEFNIIYTSIKVILLVFLVYSFFLFRIIDYKDKNTIIGIFRKKSRSI